MILFPAIDLKNGECVRLKLGRMEDVTIYNSDPVDQAQVFADAGFEWLHVVDLDGAFSGRPENALAVEAILKSVSLPVQLGGGIRDRATVEHWLNLGVFRVILGTVAVRDPQLVREVARAYPERIVVGIDARDGMVAVEGWAETSTLKVEDLAQRFADAGVAAIIHTDIDRDGILTGLNFNASRALALITPLPVIVSGGLASIDDIKALIHPENSVLAGAVSGRALYDGRIDARAALQLIATARVSGSC
jgi:phosphoribosylformimino-5-aminoimidazole carboxamide ribotide isomerase